MDMVERVARALCRADLNSDPDKLLTPAPGETRRFAWELYVDDAKAAIRAMLEGLEQELALTELANIEGASDEWLNGFRFAVSRLSALKEVVR